MSNDASHAGVAHHEIRTVKLTDLNPAPYNPRKIDKAALAGLAASMDRFGVLEPIVWNKRSRNVVGGHQRLKVLLAEGVKETQVVVVDMDEAAEQAANLTLNNPGVAGEFDDNLPDILDGVRKALSLEDFMALRLDLLDVSRDDTDLSLDPDLNYAIQVTCSSETEQRRLIEQFEGEGLTCKPLIW